MHHYVYKIKDMENDLFYIGVRSSKIEPKEDLGFYYFSSGKEEFQRRQKQNPENFKYFVVQTFNKRIDANNFEKNLIREYKSNPKCINGGIRYIHKIKAISYASQDLTKYLGNLIKLSRTETKMTQQELADRINVSRGLIKRIEAGETGVSIGAFFEAAIILGIPLLGGSKNNINNISKLIAHIHKLIPNERGIAVCINDNF